MLTKKCQGRIIIGLFFLFSALPSIACDGLDPQQPVDSALIDIIDRSNPKQNDQPEPCYTFQGDTGVWYNVCGDVTTIIE